MPLAPMGLSPWFTVTLSAYWPCVTGEVTTCNRSSETTCAFDHCDQSPVS
ncbi:MAG: hypothetical protein QM765_33040 [Myxococcales bacterium]